MSTTPQWESIDMQAAAPIRAPSLAEQTYETMKGWIVRGQLEPGAPLSENDLARRFEISRSPLREAIRRLQEEGLLAASGPRGFSVPVLTVDYVRQVYGVRQALEVAAAGTATDIPAAELDTMGVRLAEVQAALDASNAQPFNETDFPFHDLFIMHCGNPLLIQYVHRLRANIQRIINFAGRFPGHMQASQDEHLTIFAALRAGNTQDLQDSVYQHIAGVTNRLAAHLESGVLPNTLEGHPNE